MGAHTKRLFDQICDIYNNHVISVSISLYLILQIVLGIEYYSRLLILWLALREIFSYIEIVFSSQIIYLRAALCYTMVWQ